MTFSPTPAQIRDVVARTFAELADNGLRPMDLGERILIEDGDYLARSYRWEQFFAMWLVDVGILQFYDDEGNMLRMINLLEESRAYQRAA